MNDLGTLERVNIRTVWENEASNFTPWLAENLILLAEALGIEIETEDVVTEVPVGKYSADLLCIDSSDRSRIVIEIQFGSTDHDHLGKLLTYASILDSDPPVGSVIWISETFNDEHCSTLDWLNTISCDEIRFFGVKVELLRIEESKPAPRFDVVASPDNRTKVKRASSTRIVSSLERQYQQFWTDLIELLSKTETGLKPPTPPAKRSLRFRIGNAGTEFAIRCRLSEQKRQLQVALEIKGEHPNERFRVLEQQRSAIEEEIGNPLNWQENTNGRACVISLSEPGNPIEESDRAIQIEWMAQTIDKFDTAFRNRVLDLTAQE